MQIKIVKDRSEGKDFAKNLLYKVCDKDTVLFLSGGSTPKELYQVLAKEKKLNLGAAALVDERFKQETKNKKQKSEVLTNEDMIKDTGLAQFFKKNKIPFYTILEKKGLIESSKDYQDKASKLFNAYRNKVAIMGIGDDGHTAGIPTRKQKSENKNQNFREDLVDRYTDFPGEFKERITLTFNALSQMDLLIVLVFGSSKLAALMKMKEKGPLYEIPARFYLSRLSANKTILITDNKL